MNKLYFKYLALLPINILTPPSNHGAIIGLTLDGNVRYNLQSTDGPFITTTCALQVGNLLIVGSLKSDFVGILPLDLMKTIYFKSSANV